MSSVESRLSYIRPNNNLSVMMQNQRSGDINTPKSGRPVPADEYVQLTQTIKSNLDEQVDYIRRVAERQQRTEQVERSLIPEEKFTVQPRGLWVDIYV